MDDIAGKSDKAYLDIETDYLGEITVIGIFRYGFGMRQLVAPRIDANSLLKELEGSDVITTYNGNSFDLPMIRKRLNVDLKQSFTSDDLMYRCRKLKLNGGQKKVEVQLGISRETDGMDGRDAVKLWTKYERDGSSEALHILLRYNADDVLGLVAIDEKISVLEEMKKNVR